MNLFITYQLYFAITFFTILEFIIIGNVDRSYSYIFKSGTNDFF